MTVNASRDLCRFGRPLGINTDSLKIFYTGGEKVSASLIKDLNEVLPGTLIQQAYGQTEATGLLTAFNANVPEDIEMSLKKPASCGRPLITVDEYKVGLIRLNRATINYILGVISCYKFEKVYTSLSLN